MGLMVNFFKYILIGLLLLTSTNTYAILQPQIPTLDRAVSVEEEDGSPSVADASKVKVSNGTLTDNGDGTVSITTGAGGGVNNNLDNLTGHFTTKILQVGGLGTSGTVSADTVTANTVSGNSINGGRIYGEIVGSANLVTGNTVSGTTVTGNTIYATDIRSNLEPLSNAPIRVWGDIRLAYNPLAQTAVGNNSNTGYVSFQGGKEAETGSGFFLAGNSFAGAATLGPGDFVQVIKRSGSRFRFQSGTTDIVTILDNGTVSPNSVLSSNIYSDTIIGCGQLITANTVTANTISGNTITLGGAGIYLPLGTPTDNQIIKYDSASGKLGWESDADSGVGGGVNNNLDNLTGHVTTKVLEVGGLGTSGTVSASTVSGQSVVGGRGYFDIFGGLNVSANTVSGNSIDSWIISGNSVKTGYVGNNLTNFSTIQFTIASPDSLDETSKLVIWSNNTGRTFNVTQVLAWSSVSYNVVMNRMTPRGNFDGGLADFNTMTFTDSGATSIYAATPSTVSFNTISDSTVIYLDPSVEVANYIKVTLKGYFS